MMMSIYLAFKIIQWKVTEQFGNRLKTSKEKEESRQVEESL